VQQRTAHLLNAKSTYARQLNLHVETKVLIGQKRTPWPDVTDPHTAMAIFVHRPVIVAINEQIKRIETEVRSHLKENEAYRLLQKMPGIGPILAWSILLEAGDIHRFAKVGNFTSYCRCVQAIKISNGKKKAESNKKNGNPYLAWAFHEAAHTAIRYMEHARKYYERKSRQRNRMVAMKALSHKIARASYFILRDHVMFDADKLFKH
jgi:transposase